MNKLSLNFLLIRIVTTFFSNLLSTTIVDKGQYNVCKSTYEESLRIQLPITLNKPHLIGNQDDILVNAQQKYTIKQVSGKVPYGGISQIALI